MFGIGSKKEKTKETLGWMAKKEAKILFTALATVGTHQALKKIGKMYPQLKVLKKVK